MAILLRNVLGFGLLVLVLGIGGASLPAHAASAVDPLAERSLGDPNAPVTIVEFSSLTCPHCASFHLETLPKIKKDYIDTGKARLVFSDFPLGRLAMGAAMVARCVEPERYFGFLEMLFRGQSSWATSPEPRKELERLARFGGLSKTEFDACLDNQALFQGIRERAGKAEERHGINSTPTFIIGDGKVVGAQDYEDLKKAIDEALAKKR